MSSHPQTVPPHLPLNNPAPLPPNGDVAEPRQATAALLERLRALDAPDADAGDTGGLVRPRRRRWAIGALLVLVGAGLWSAVGRFSEPYHDLDLKYQPVERGKITFTVVEKGELEAVRNSEVICKVRNRAGTWFATSIKWLIEDGTQVKKGDVVARLEDSSLKEQYQTQKIAVTEKRALLFEADREIEIVESQNQIAIKTAEHGALIAKINLDKFLKGDTGSEAERRERSQDAGSRRPQTVGRPRGLVVAHD